ncbi:MAG: metallophosphoesterase [Firmicutes bacterium]|nr:metallophosphoesterase [Bacillota bacterium]
MLWTILPVMLVLIIAGVLLYIVVAFRRFRFIKKLKSRSRFLSAALSALIPLCILLSFLLWINLTTAAVVLLHLFLFWVISDLLFAVVKKIRKKEGKYYYAGVMALTLTAVLLIWGWVNFHQVRRTSYELNTDKSLDAPCRVVEIADSHLGVTMSGEAFAKELARINQENADVLVIVGDFVDDDTPKEDMLTACEALGNVRTKYGIYFVYGNHDKGYYQYRDFTSQELRNALAQNGVTILEDETVLLENGLTIIGRQDRTASGRASAPSLTADLDRNRYLLMLDHQPNDYSQEAASEADLVLSGHTHGGHIFPVGQIGIWMGANDKTYGYEMRGQTGFIVTSGISGWAVPIKTGTFSEYVVIDITPLKANAMN